MKQPLVAVALCYGAGVILGHFIEAPLLATFIVALVLTFAAIFLALARPLLLPLLLFLFGWLNMSTREAIISPFDLRTVIREPAQLISVRGRLAESPAARVNVRNEAETWHTRAEIKVSEVRLPRGDWQPAFGWLMSRTPGVLSSNCFAGQIVEVTGIALIPSPPIAEGVFDYRRYLQLRRIYYEFKVESPKDWKTSGNQSPPIADIFRAWGQRTLARGLPEQDESLRLQWAMLLGWQTALTAEVSEPFMRSGTMHIFAISGLHIALIAGIFVALLRAILVPRALCGLIVIPILWFYTAATGWQASAIRSTVMMTVIIAGWSLKRPVNLLNSLAMAACVILVWQPEQLFQAGFQLSFFVVLSIALLTPPIERFREKVFALDPLLPFNLRPRWQRVGLRIGGTFWTFFATSLAALVGSTPLIAYYFHLFTPGSLLANLVVVPASSLALVSGLSAMVTGEFLPTITEFFNHSGWFWMRSMIFLSETAAALPCAWFHVRSPGLGVFVIYYGLLLALCAGWMKQPAMRWVTISSTIVLALACWFTWKRERSWHRVTALPLNGGHALYVQPRGADEWLIDCGDNYAVDFTLKPFLQAQGENSLANFLLTQGDARQIGGVSRLQEVFPVQQALSSPAPSRSPRYRDALSELELKSKLRRYATNGFKATPWMILHPSSTDRFPASGDNAVVALGTFDGVRVLLVPNLGHAGQNAVAARHPELRADVIIAGLPNRGEPLASEWLAVLRPKLVIITDSELPATRRASSDLAKRIRKSGAAFLSTRSSGAVTLAIRDGEWRVKTARPGDVTQIEL